MISKTQQQQQQMGSQAQFWKCMKVSVYMSMYFKLYVCSIRCNFL